MNNNFVSIIIPAYNESENLEILFDKIVKTFNESKYKNIYEAIIVNDGSSDNLAELSKKLIKKNYKFKIINLKNNLGKAYAVEIGILNSIGKYIAIIDADLQYEPKDLIKMLNKIDEGFNMINGKRLNRKDDPITKFFSKIYNLLINLIFNVKCKDLFSGIKVFNREIYQLMEFNGLVRFVIFFSKKFNFKIIEIDIDHNQRFKGETKYNFFQRVLLTFKDIFALIICIKLGKEGIYQLKQLILVVYFFLYSFFILSGFNEEFNFEVLFNLTGSLILLIILNLIIKSFLKKKDKKSFNLKNSIKSIIKN